LIENASATYPIVPLRTPLSIGRLAIVDPSTDKGLQVVREGELFHVIKLMRYQAEIGISVYLPLTAVKSIKFRLSRFGPL
jgi:hypothetical protein